MGTFQTEVEKGERFEFGKNWQSFLSTLNEDKTKVAEKSIKDMLGIKDLEGKTMLDIGSGSGLSSLAARNLGAEVHSFDYDPESVACTRTLRAHHFSSDPDWIIEQGSILDEEYLESLDESYDIVYSWGVLHHTGDMWTALENAASLVEENGYLFIALYNDQGVRSRFWEKVKAFYCSGRAGKVIISTIFIPYFFSRVLLSSIIKGKNIFVEYKQNRGMSILHDWFDWLGGYPFEVAKVEEVFHFLGERGFDLENIKTTNTLGTNQFVFTKEG